jgi:hypothetical protein
MEGGGMSEQSPGGRLDVDVAHALNDVADQGYRQPWVIVALFLEALEARRRLGADVGDILAAVYEVSGEPE